MCSRFELDVPAAELAQRFGLKTTPPMPNRPELRPTDLALVIAPDGADLLAWGLRVDWNVKPLINARAESLSEKKTFRGLLENRCLVPASAYFEWRKDGCVKLKNRIEKADKGIFAFAGLIGGDRFTIITCTPRPNIAHIHHRMPVILDGEAETPWIDPDTPFEAVSSLLIPTLAEPLIAEEEPRPTGRQPDLFG